MPIEHMKTITGVESSIPIFSKEVTDKINEMITKTNHLEEALILAGKSVVLCLQVIEENGLIPQLKEKEVDVDFYK